MSGDKCEECGEYVDPHADNHQCPGSVSDRLYSLEARISVLQDENEDLKDVIHGLLDDVRRLERIVDRLNAQI